ncbi:Shikimate kinase [uncultured Desulfobacterium sp.]|uniref:Shikimate kinase n=1 Tax=uncultured Desulfobacterium sp. TaxID=201089 RepID=A0A445MWD1_9BACT|nr:Shikimate kinase [uncultured Desulfobacterium sp.]
MNIVLIGYRGTGKSAVAEILSDALQMKSIGMDAEIVKRAGISIPEIVQKYGWPRFRDMETDLAREIGLMDNIIVDTGGGVIERSENIEALRQNGLTFWLKASVEMIVKRIETGTDRPALTDGKSFTEEVREVLENRLPKYSGAASYDIDTDNMDPDQVAARIIEIWKGVKDQAN